LPDGHPDVDDLFFDHKELSDWHPDLSLVVNEIPIEPIYVFRYDIVTGLLYTNLFICCADILALQFLVDILT